MTKQKAFLLQIGEVAKQAGTTLRTVRYYMEQGFIEEADRSPGGFYLFEPHTVETVRHIQALKDLGLPLKEIKALYDIRREKSTGDEAYPLVRERLIKHQELVEEKILEYESLCAELREATELVNLCKGCRKKPNRANCTGCEKIDKWKDLPAPFAAIL